MINLHFGLSQLEKQNYEVEIKKVDFREAIVYLDQN